MREEHNKEMNPELILYDEDNIVEKKYPTYTQDSQDNMPWHYRLNLQHIWGGALPLPSTSQKMIGTIIFNNIVYCTIEHSFLYITIDLLALLMQFKA